MPGPTHSAIDADPAPGVAPAAAALAALVQLARATLARRPGMVVLGLSGAQGSGKTTLASALAADMTARGIATAQLSLDDLYLTRAERVALAARIHPLLITRGVPGTHDTGLGLATIAALTRGEPAPLPRFDKASDDRRPRCGCAIAPRQTRLLIVEGWCIGALPQSAAELVPPVNTLETVEDPDAVWRSYINRMLAGDYARLWARIDALAMIRAPDFATVIHWRQQQEHALARYSAGSAIMDDAGVARFVAHFERITRVLLHVLPPRADLVIGLDRDRQVTGLTWTGPTRTGVAMCDRP